MVDLNICTWNRSTTDLTEEHQVLSISRDVKEGMVCPQSSTFVLSLLFLLAETIVAINSA